MKRLLLILLFAIVSCSGPRTKHIVIQPLGNFDASMAKEVLVQVKAINPNVILRKNMDFPPKSYNQVRGRYRADSIIKYLNARIGEDSVVVGLTHKDISTTKGKFQDWGIMGLGYRPGKACVISDYRLASYNKKEQFHKVVLHELGHTEGLSHCPEKTCLMRDAEGANVIDEEKGFCEDCTAFLKNHGWKFNKTENTRQNPNGNQKYNEKNTTYSIDLSFHS
ncbi:Zn-dependent protease [Flavobacterium silvaticum]|uniref:Zn-dependent protease n=1 Tax=Flavobacterium silvaticum TaxID=1852020 RepID=A0A972FIQ3_9FLAO|nr:Zn-dependent protease [Flavobacterium silvaticum]NMH26754.1 Zn-dependent protease [Flavobacterium silvaticum]